MELAFFGDADGVSTDDAVALFALGLAPRLGEVAMFGRLDPEPRRAPYTVDGPNVRYVQLPHYDKLTDVASVSRAIRGSCAIFSSELDQLDAVWLFPPSPMALVFAAVARRRGTPVIFGLRQDTPQYIANRLPSRRWLWAVPLAHGFDRVQRRLARRVPTTVVGRELAQKFGADRNPVLEMGVSLVRDSDLMPLDAALNRSWDGELRLLSVGRLEQEKNSTLLADIVAQLRDDDPRWTLDVAGLGSLMEPLRERARELGVQQAVRLHGYVPNGEPLQELYRNANAFLHVSLTEGLPQVLFEAHAAGLPIVATDVGGVSDALSGGSTGLLIAPRDADAAARALERLRDDRGLRSELIESGLRSVRSQTMDVQLDRVAAFMREHVLERGAEPPSAARRRRRLAARGPRGANVLMFHDVAAVAGEDPGGFEGPGAERYQIDLARFEQHLDQIEAGGARVGVLNESGNGPAVAITFDDGGNSALRIADALERRGWRGHFFITTDRIGAPRFVDLDALTELARRGHVVGSHSHTHPDAMGQLPAARVLEEWERSRDVLSDALGAAPTFASVPGGALSPAVIRTAARAGYRVLMTSNPSSRIQRYGDLSVVGRYAVRSTTPTGRVAGFAGGSLAACGTQWLAWQAKGAARRLSPSLYRIAAGASSARQGA